MKKTNANNHNNDNSLFIEVGEVQIFLLSWLMTKNPKSKRQSTITSPNIHLKSRQIYPPNKKLSTFTEQNILNFTISKSKALKEHGKGD